MSHHPAVIAFVLLAWCWPAHPGNSQPACSKRTPIVKSVGDPHEDFLIALARHESSGEGCAGRLVGKKCVNYAGYLGLFQMGDRALADAGFYKLGASKDDNAWDGSFSERAAFVDVVSRDSYLDYAGAQELAVRAYHRVLWQRIVRLKLDGKIGAIIDNIELTKSGMLAGSHLVGLGGLISFIRSNGAVVKRDGDGTPITQYLKDFGSYY